MTPFVRNSCLDNPAEKLYFSAPSFDSEDSFEKKMRPLQAQQPFAGQHHV
jgi:hypothetical protein